ncbi:MAG: UDP-N-acetylmuramoyl-L-alanine--D-glutamate ligase [Oscillospiraceae bacterium]|nr:UDP-N-acetylmuramoyl-L-alanine--D-glutamate ligase [Oscillospiraceae bacterium]
MKSGKLESYIKSLKSKHVVVVGAGISNTPLIKLLLAAKVNTTVCDKRSREELGEVVKLFEEQGATFKLGDGYLNNLNADIIFRTPGLMPSNPAIRDVVSKGAILTSEMEVFFELCPCTTIGVTGSDGKTTTTSIIAELLRNDGYTVHLGGNIGTPLLSIADSIKPDDYAVIELSSFQLITMRKSPNIAVVTNLSPNHLDVHNDMDEYVEAKSNIFIHQNKCDRAVLNLDNEFTSNYAKSAVAGEVLFFSRREKVRNGVYLKNGIIYEAKDDSREEIMHAKDIILPGIHNVENYLAAFTATLGIVSHKSMRSTAKSFNGVGHRLEFVRDINGVKYYNDSIASSPSRAIAGIRALSANHSESKAECNQRNIILIAGGKDKGIAFNELGVEIATRVKALVLTGATAGLIREAVDNAQKSHTSTYECSGILEVMHCDDFNDAVVTASKIAQDGDIVLLSPACTSFDAFNNFEERGNLFKEIVNRINLCEA